MKNSFRYRAGISLRIVNAEKYNEPRDALSHDWINFLKSLNIMPILIPNKIENIESYIMDLKLDFIILSGGDNLGETPERDSTEKRIIEFSIEKNIPIFGVCRGMQIINNFLGGNLTVDTKNRHVSREHPLKIIDKNFESVLEGSSIQVNSYHKNIVKNKNLGKELISFATTDGEDVEGFFHEKHPIVGVMWHPERENKPHDKILIEKLVRNGKFWK